MHIYFMLSYVKATSQQLAVAQFFTSLPPTPLYLFSVLIGYYILPDSLFFLFSFVLYLCVFVLE